MRVLSLAITWYHMENGQMTTSLRQAVCLFLYPISILSDSLGGWGRYTEEIWCVTYFQRWLRHACAETTNVGHLFKQYSPAQRIFYSHLTSMTVCTFSWYFEFPVSPRSFTGFAIYSANSNEWYVLCRRTSDSVHDF